MPTPSATSASAVTSATSKSYKIDNSTLNSETNGILYRSSKDLQAIADSLAEWGSIVTGIDEGDGWLAVQDKYLPFQIRETTVLTPAPETPDKSKKPKKGIVPGGLNIGHHAGAYDDHDEWHDETGKDAAEDR